MTNTLDSALIGGSHSVWVRKLLTEKHLIPNGDGNKKVCSFHYHVL